MSNCNYHTALSIAGSDSSGGAGVQADLKTFSALGVYGMTAITALTAQNTLGVDSIMPATPEIVAAQIDAVFADIRPDAVKIGMLFNTPIIEAVAGRLSRHSPTHIVLDPVMISTSGCPLISDDAIAALIELLMPIATVITPNKSEAERIAGIKIGSTPALLDAGQRILAMGAKAVLIKGGHFDSDMMTDYLFTSPAAEPARLTAPAVATSNTHGTGCTLSSAIAAYLALGNSLLQATALAKSYLHKAIVAGADAKTGNGHGPVNHFFQPSRLITKQA